MSLVVHNYSTSTIRVSSSPLDVGHKDRVLEGAWRLISPDVQWLDVDLGFLSEDLQALDVYAEGEDITVLDDWIHWDGSRPPAIEPKREMVPAGDDAVSSEAVSAFASPSVDDIEDEDGGDEVEDASGGHFIFTRTSALLTKPKIPLTHPPPEEVVPDSESETEESFSGALSILYNDFNASIRRPSTTFPTSRSQYLDEDVIIEDSLLYEADGGKSEPTDNSVTYDEDSAPSDVFRASGIVSSLNRLGSSSEPSDEDDERAVEDSLRLDVHYGSDSDSEDSGEGHAVTNSLRQSHDESYDSKEADTAFIDFQDDNDDGTSLINSDRLSSPLPVDVNPRLLPPRAPLALLPPIIHPPPRLQSTSPRKRPNPPRIDRPIFSPPKRIAPARSSPLSPRLTPNSQSKSQSISEIMDADDFTARSPPPAKRQKRELVGEWDGDLISEWVAPVKEVEDHPIKEEVQDDGLNYPRSPSPGLILPQEHKTEIKPTSFLVKVIPYPHQHVSLRRPTPRFDLPYSPDIPDEENPDMRFGWTRVGIIIAHPFVTLPLWNKLLEVRKELGVGVAFPKDDEYEGGGYIKVYVDAPLRLEIRRRLREWEKVGGGGARIRMRLVSDVGEYVDEEGWI
ncbi:hypothetical protein BDZ89DRAFT_1078802 [Hymenopellis radicata]|nr:hypothetical protein BDZ89DRAFT_1078802 [Hymenopellis radicata]